MGITADLLVMVDARIRSAMQRVTASGTVQSVAGMSALVLFDGSSFPVPVKYAASVRVVPDARVTLLRVGSDWVVTSSFDRSAGGPQQVESTATVATSSTTPAAGSPVLWLPFIAPAAGAVWITVAGHVWSNNNTAAAVLSYEVWDGDQPGQGAQILAPLARHGLMTSEAVNTGATADLGASGPRRMLTGLTPGETYSVQTMLWMTSAGGGSVDYRLLTVEPVL